MGPSAAVADVRHAVRACLSDLADGELVLAACSGGADSLALAAALAFVAPRAGLRGGGVTVDHGLQPGSAQRAAGLAGLMTKLGLDPVRAITVTVSEGAGPEAAARAARYEALGATAREHQAAAVLLGHTLDDQAETVLLGLARGSGGRSLAGMPARRDPYRRPLLGLRRATTAAACAELGLLPWQDPHNSDVRFARARVRHQALPALEDALGHPGPRRARVRGKRTAPRARLRPGRPGRRAPRRAARRDQDPGAAGRGDHGGLPARRPGRGACRADRRPGDRLARAGLGRPARPGAGRAP